MRTLKLHNGTTLVIRQIAAVGPVEVKEETIEAEIGEPDPPPRRWCIFGIWLVGGTKMYPPIEYDGDGVQANIDRTNVVAHIEQSGKVNEL